MTDNNTQSAEGLSRLTAYFWQQNNKDAFYDKAVSVKSVRMVA